MDQPLRLKFEAKYNKWKERLLDIGAGNRLVNFRATKVSTVQITSPDLESLFQRLVIAERSLKFPLFQGEEAPRLFEREESTEAKTPRYKVRPGDLETSKSPPDLEKSLYRLAALGRASKEERGVNTLYVALGILEWRPLDDSASYKAPLLLVPVQLERENRLSPYVLGPFDEDVEANPTLAFMLKQDFGLSLPDFDPEPTEGSLRTFLAAVERRVRAKEWNVLPEAWLAQLHFKKLAMYKDIEEHRAGAADNPRVVAVAGLGGFGDPPEIGEKSTFDEIPPSQVFTVLDADSSQMEAVLRARGGQSIIIQGPPGTGKSQTITNLIAQFLLEGKRILFVSEKMAALSVVHKRLEDVGLAPFCLEIHSDKANKRDVLHRIGRATQVAPPTTQRRARIAFDRLLLLRKELNAYVRALHQPTINGRSAFEIHGDLAQLASVPEVAAKLALPTARINADREQGLLRQARRLAQMPDMLLHYFEHPWFGCKLGTWSMEAQSEMEAHLDLFVESLKAVTPISNQLAEAMRIPVPDSLTEMRSLLELANIFSVSPCAPRSWLGDAALDELRDEAGVLARQQERHHVLRQELLRFYSPRLFDQDCALTENALCQSEGQLLLSMRGTERYGALAQNATPVSNLLGDTIEALSRLEEAGNELAVALSEQEAERRRDYRRLAEVALIASSDPRPTKDWFDPLKLQAFTREAKEATKRQARLRELRTTLRAEFTRHFLDLPLQRWKSEFRERYTGFFRFLSSDYRRAMKAIRSTRTQKGKFTYPNALEWIDLGAEAHETQAWFEQKSDYYSATFGYHFNGIDTDWPDVVSRLERTQALLEFYRGADLADGLAQALLSGGVALQRISHLGEHIQGAEATIDQSISGLEQYMSVRNLAGLADGIDTPISAAKEGLSAALRDLNAFNAALMSMTALFRPDIQRAPAQIAGDAQAAREVQELEDAIEKAKATLVERYGSLFGGIDTRWDAIISALDWAGRFRDFVSKRSLGPRVLDAACASQIVRTVGLLIPELAPVVERINGGQQYVASTLDLETARLGDATIDSCDLRYLSGWLQKKIGNIGSMSEWIQFQSLRRESEENGLAEFVTMALEKKIPAESLELALRKRILTLQLDELYKELPILRDFSWRDHEDVVQQFKKLDRDLMKAYAELVKASVIERQPRLQGPSVGQLGFLRRELAKQKRHAPLRRLFKECSEIILGLAPCLLMSPLSVATFLPKDSVEFDVLIFDEASQIPSEEAIGSLLRCKQVIVAGDTKQLPPTRFFERSLDDGGEEYEETEAEVLESLLEDCNASGMQGSPLNWHYRSRHESLIAFSNAEFYNNSLISFPAPVNPAPDHMGVRLEYVSDGVYDRGRSRTNRIEAQRVAKLVERHLDTWGTQRSLGVIALSSAQEHAIDEEIECLLRERPDLEELIQPREKEQFFVKPLENVQGDERDTILISIGYGKDSSGILSLNFGPINTSGGQRRLNVAVTRARWQTIVVTSILAHDIDESRVNTQGPKVLKRYLHFAKEGRLPVESIGSGGESESPFELAVYDALRDRGLNVDRQIGASSYRIDLAVRDPEKPGRYLLGIECDGASYHSAAVARDRDRLRQEVLENLGWKIHRIWSTDWIRNRKEAIQRTLDLVEKLRNRPEPSDRSEEPPDGSAPQGPGHGGSREDDDGPLLAIHPDADPYAAFVSAYSETSPSRRRRDDFYDNDNSDIREDILRVVEHEGPIHEELIVQRVARMYRLQRVGSTVDQTIRHEISSLARSSRISRKGKFLWPPGSYSAQPRRNSNGQGPRPIQYVAPEELEEAAMIVLRITRGVTRHELISEIARVLGYARTGDKVERAALEAMKRLVKAGRLVERAGFLIPS
jgi:very-short-patch-repair endonuclease